MTRPILRLPGRLCKQAPFPAVYQFEFDGDCRPSGQLKLMHYRIVPVPFTRVRSTPAPDWPYACATRPLPIIAHMFYHLVHTITRRSPMPRGGPISNTNALRYGRSSPGGAFPLSALERGPGAVLSRSPERSEGSAKEGEVRLSPLSPRPRLRTIKGSGHS